MTEAVELHSWQSLLAWESAWSMADDSSILETESESHGRSRLVSLRQAAARSVCKVHFSHQNCGSAVRSIAEAPSITP